VRNKYFVLGRVEQPRQNKNLFYRHDKLKEPIKEGPLSYVLFESPFISVSKVSRGHHSLVSVDRASVMTSGTVLAKATVRCGLLYSCSFYESWELENRLKKPHYLILFLIPGVGGKGGGLKKF
jgi:hypothetical protein